MKTWKILIVICCLGYAAIYAYLTRSIEPNSSHEFAHDREADFTPKQKVIQGMAEYVEKVHEEQHKIQTTPSVAQSKSHYFPDEKPLEIGSFEINDQLKEQMATPEGVSALQKQMGDRAEAMSTEVEAAFERNHFRNAEEQTTLLDLAHVLSHVIPESKMTKRLSTEAERYLIPSDHQDSLYGGRALQYYLDSEPDQEKRSQFVRSLHPDASQAH